MPSHFQSCPAPRIYYAWPPFGSAQGAAKFNQPLSFDTSSVTTMSAMFDMSSAAGPDSCSRRLSFGPAFNSPVNFWDTSRVTSMHGMFRHSSAFNQPLNFDTSRVTDMSEMFQGASAFNEPLSFDTSRVIDMAAMFAQASALNKLLSFVDTSRVTDMSSMLQQATAFNQPLNFDTSRVTDMSSMLQGAISFDQPLYFDFSSVIDMTCMLATTSCTGDPWGRRRRALSDSCIVEDEPLVFNHPITLGTTRRVTDLTGMFAGSKFNQPVSLDTSGVTSMKAMFQNATAFDQPLSFDTSRVTDMSDMFQNATAFDQPLSFDTSSVTDMSDMFQATSSLSDANKLIIRCAWAGNSAFDSTYGAGWVSGDCSLPPACTFTFADKSLKTAVKEFDSNARAAVKELDSNARAAIRKYGPIADWCVSRVTDMSSLFRGMGDFNANISSWDTSRVTTMRYMFQARPSPAPCMPRAHRGRPRRLSQHTSRPAARPVPSALLAILGSSRRPSISRSAGTRPASRT